MFYLEKIINNIPVNKSNCHIIFYLNILIILLIIFFILYSFKIFNQENFSNIDEDNDLNDALNLGICSRKCCPPYWSNEKIIDKRVKDEDINKKIFTSNLFCSNGDGNKGCICLTKNSINLLSNRGFVK